MANDDSQISSCLSTLFLSDFELPDLNEVKLILSKHREKLDYDNGLDSLIDIICALLLQKSQFFKIRHNGHNTASNMFTKKYSYQGNLLDKNTILVAIELVLKQEELLSYENVQSIVDHQKCVVLFNQITIRQLNYAFDYLQELFQLVCVCVFENELLVPSKEKKRINSKIMKMKKGLDEVDQKL